MVYLSFPWLHGFPCCRCQALWPMYKPVLLRMDGCLRCCLCIIEDFEHLGRTKPSCSAWCGNPASRPAVAISHDAGPVQGYEHLKNYLRCPSGDHPSEVAMICRGYELEPGWWIQGDSPKFCKLSHWWPMRNSFEIRKSFTQMALSRYLRMWVKQ